MRKNKYRNLTLILISFGALFLQRGLFHSPNGAPKAKQDTPPEQAFVLRVIDGDTILINNGLRVRYIGINTPETKHPKMVVEFFGKEASDFNTALVLRKEVRLEYDVQKFDRYGRLLAYVYVGEIFVNAKLVEDGYAQVFTVPPNVKYAKALLDLQRMAKSKKRGLWARSS